MAPTLVTAYQPFQGRGKNGSSTLLRWLRGQLDKSSHLTEILPVNWQAAPSRLRELVELHRPHRIFSMGEGQPARVAFETLAQNVMLGTDEFGNHRSGGPIQAIGPMNMDATFPEPTARQISLLPQSINYVVSRDAGVFLCNRLLWEGLNLDVPQVGFLHVPPQGAMPDDEYVAGLGPFVRSLLLPPGAGEINVS